MSDNFLFKALKGAAKMGASYMSSTADSLSRSNSYSDEQREQFREIHNAFSEMKDKLNDNTSASDENDNDNYCYEDTSYKQESNNVVEKTLSQNSNHRYFNKVTFAKLQWYLIHRNKSDNTAILLSKDILKTMPFSTNKNKNAEYETSQICQWLNNEFKMQLEYNLKNSDKKRLIKIFLLSSKEASIYMLSGERRVEKKDGTSSWWLSDKEGEFIKTVKKSGGISTSPATDIRGVRPAILIKLREKDNMLKGDF